jgi:hypothetical protein
MKRRIGDKTNPSAVLLDQHVTWMNSHYGTSLLAASVPAVKLQVCRAAIANLAAWLGWLRAMETFLLKWGHVKITPPPEGPREGLPLGMGVVKLDLLAQTKSSQSRVVDMVISS